MAYEEPGIKVIQELQAAAANLQSADQALAIVGPLYEVFEDQVHGTMYDAVTGAGNQTYDWPGKKTTSVVDLSSVRKAIAEVDSQLAESAEYPLAWSLRDPGTQQVFDLDPLTDVQAISQSGFTILDGVDAAVARDSGSDASAAVAGVFHLPAGGFLTAGAITGDRMRLTNGQFDVIGDVTVVQDDNIFFSADGHSFTVSTASSAQAQGSIDVVAVSKLVDSETFVLDDGTNPAVTFEFDDDASVSETGTLRQVDISAISTALEVRDAIISAINTAPTLNITASVGGVSQVALINDNYGTAGNVAITDTVADSGFVVTGMTGGTNDTALVADVVGESFAGLEASGRLLVGSGATQELVDYSSVVDASGTHTFTVSAMAFAHAVGESVIVQVLDTAAVTNADGDLVDDPGHVTLMTGTSLTDKEDARLVLWVEEKTVNDGATDAADGNVFESATMGFTSSHVGRKVSLWAPDNGTVLTAANYSVASNVLTDTSAPFTAADVGKWVEVEVSSTVYRTRIIGYTDTQNVTLTTGVVPDGAGSADGVVLAQETRTILSVGTGEVTVDGTALTVAQTGLPLTLHRPVYRDAIDDDTNSSSKIAYSGSAVSSDTGWLYHIPVDVYDADLTYEIFPAYELLVDYRALDVSSVNQELGATSSSDLTALGTVSKYNPLLWAAQAALTAMGTDDTTIILLPVDLYADAATGSKTGYPEDKVESLAYLNALDILERNEAAYFLVPLTRNATVRDAFDTHVGAMSDPCEKRERVCYLTYDLPKGDVESTTGVIAPGLSGGNKLISDSGQNFLSTHQLIPGNTVVIETPEAYAGTYTVAAGSTEDELVLEGDNWQKDSSDAYLAAAKEFTIDDGDFDSVAGELDSATANAFKDVETGDYLLQGTATRRITAVKAGTGGAYSKLEYEGLALTGTSQTVSILRTSTSVNYHVNPHTAAEQATALKAISESRGDRRVVHIWPDQVGMVTGSDAQGNDVVENLPSYYAAAAEAGRDAVLRPERSSTGEPLAGFVSLEHSNFYFKKSQLNTIAEGGWAILHQPTRGGSVRMRHLLTTDMSTVKNQELAFTKNVDNMAKVMRRTLEPQLNDDDGRVNITDDFLRILTFPVQGVNDRFVANRQLVRTSGTPPYQILSITQDTTQPDRILIRQNANVPLPANNVEITLVI